MHYLEMHYTNYYIYPKFNFYQKQIIATEQQQQQ